MIVLDVDDELGERVEVETAAPEPAGIREERSGGDARHVFGRGAFTGWRGPGAGVVNEEAEASGPGWERGRARSGAAEQTPGGRRSRLDSGGRSWEAGGTLGVGTEGGGGLAGGSYVTTCLPVGTDAPHHCQ